MHFKFDLEMHAEVKPNLTGPNGTGLTIQNGLHDVTVQTVSVQC